jgi:hypothetical protein
MDASHIIRRVMLRADGEAAWSWRPWAGVKSAKDNLQATVTNKVMDTGESAEQTVNHCAGNADALAYLW